MPARAPRLPLAVRLIVVVALAAASGTATVLTTQTTALADIKQQIRSAQAHLDDLNRASEAAAERYNHARIQYADAQRQAQIAGRALATAQHQLEASQRSISQFAATTYMNGGMGGLPAILGGHDAAEFLDRMTTVDAISRSQARAFARLAALQHQHAVAQVAADAALAAQRRAMADAEREKATVQRNAAEAQTILTDLREKQAELIRAAKAAAARQAAQARAAALARQQQLAAAAAAALQSQSLTPTAPTPAVEHYAGNAAQVALQVAKEQLGKPYVWGAAGPDSFDCSGLTLYAYGKAGISLPHYTGDQWNVGRHVSESELQPGDLVFFEQNLGHMGMYVGNGQFIHAPHTGDVVKISPLAGWYQSEYAGAVRVVG